MNARNGYLRHFVGTALIVAALAPAPLATAADLPLSPIVPAWTWTGFYIGGSAGAAAGTSAFSDPNGRSVFGDTVKISGFPAALQLVYNLQLGSRWLIGLQADAGYLDSAGSFTCMQASAEILGSNCQVSPRALASLTARAGFLVDPPGRTLIYGKTGAAWMDSDVSITPNNSFNEKFPGAPGPGASADAHANALGWTIGAGIERALTPAWSVGLEYNYYRFATVHVSTPNTITSSGGAVPTISAIAGSTAGVMSDIQVMKLVLNYHWDRDPRATWADASAFGPAPIPLKARPAATADGWEVDAGTRYWYSSGTEKNTSGSGSLISQLTYSNLTGQSGELFARLDTPARVFLKGFAGAGAITSGKNTDEDFGSATFDNVGFMVTSSAASGWLNYAAADIGYDVLRDWNYKVGPFVGYSYFRQNVNAFGCTQLEPTVAPCANGNQASLTQDETWQSLRVGVSAVATIWDRWGIDGDVAYLPYAEYSGLDSHWLRMPAAYFPQDGRGRGVQTELILTYLVTENLKLGIGGRYWAMWTTSGSQSCSGGCIGAASSPPAPYTANTERYGTFVQISYRFNPAR
jgi:opacity protein-like surface antigen